MEMIEIKASSSIAKMGWQDGKMRVQHTSSPRVYEYSNVPQTVYEMIRTAPSVGSMYHQLLKKFPKKYPYTII